MKVIKDIDVLKYADVFISEKTTVRNIARKVGISKTALHNALAYRLQQLDGYKYKKVREILDKNKKERHIRGGKATKKMWQRRKRTS